MTDLRLAGFAAAVWLSSLPALFLSARSGLLLGAGALAAAARVTHPRGPGLASVRWIAVATLLGAGCGAGMTGARVTTRESGPLIALMRAGDPVRAEAVVRDDPRAVHGSPGLPPTYLVAVDLSEVGAEGGLPLRLSARALVLGSDPGWRGLLPGQRLATRGKLIPPRGGDLRAAVLSSKETPRLIGW